MFTAFNPFKRAIFMMFLSSETRPHFIASCLVVSCLAILLTGCGESNDTAITQQQTVSQNLPQTPLETSASANTILPSDKTYTYLGGLLVPPAFFAQAPQQDYNKLQICGYDHPDASGQEICAEFGAIHHHLYSTENLGLDVWDTRDDNWYLVLVRQGLKEIWLQRPSAEFIAYPELIKKGLAFMGEWEHSYSKQAWPTEAYSAPQGAKIAIDPSTLPENKTESPLIILNDARIMPNQDVWFQVSFINNVCEAGVDANPIIANVWYPAYQPSVRLNMPSFWFYPKGC
jgi:hypothetical protein